MTRALAILLILICASAQAEPLVPKAYYDLRGPCYEPRAALNNLKENDFELVVTSTFVNGIEFEADVYIFQAESAFVVAVTHGNLLCVVVTADGFNFGV
jgi:hypothetical protein